MSPEANTGGSSHLHLAAFLMISRSAAHVDKGTVGRTPAHQYIHAACQGTPVCQELSHFPGAAHIHLPLLGANMHSEGTGPQESVPGWHGWS